MKSIGYLLTKSLLIILSLVCSSWYLEITDVLKPILVMYPLNLSPNNMYKTYRIQALKKQAKGMYTSSKP